MQLIPAFLSLVALVSAAPAELQRRGEATCGSVHYSSGQVTDASEAACKYVKNGGTAGGSSYPHQYKNYEDFEFKGLSGPFYEFPIKSSGVYTGGSPGADRVVITKSCEEAGTITHRGASGGAFVACEESKDEPKDNSGWSIHGTEKRLLGAASGVAATLLVYVL